MNAAFSIKRWQEMAHASVDALLGQLLPRLCLLCATPCGSQALCPACRDSGLPGRRRTRCRQCALPLDSPTAGPRPPGPNPAPDVAPDLAPAPGPDIAPDPGSVQPLLCPRCQQTGATVLQTVITLADYAPPLDHALTALKFHGELTLARPLGMLLMQHLHSAPAQPLSSIDALVPIPLSGARLAERGFNQSLQIARGMRACRHGHCPPILHDALIRHHHARPQSSLSRAERLHNLQNAFSVPRPARIAGRRLCLVDDVMTTGSTLQAAARALHAAGAHDIIAVVVARTA